VVSVFLLLVIYYYRLKTKDCTDVGRLGFKYPLSLKHKREKKQPDMESVYQQFMNSNEPESLF